MKTAYEITKNRNNMVHYLTLWTICRLTSPFAGIPEATKVTSKEIKEFTYNFLLANERCSTSEVVRAMIEEGVNLGTKRPDSRVWYVLRESNSFKRDGECWVLNEKKEADSNNEFESASDIDLL